MQLQQLVYFTAVADHGSINKAAETLFLTQSNLSKAIINLESELKIHIFHRTNKGVALTDEGKKLYQYARSILDQMELISGISRKERVRSLTIASYPIITISRLVSQFYNRHPDGELFLQLVECRMQKVIESVENGESEIGFAMINNVQDKEVRHTMRFKDLEFNPLGTDTWYANLGPKNPLYDRDEVDIRELMEFPVVRLPDDYFSNLTFYLEIDGMTLTEFKKTVYVNDSAAILNLLSNTNVFRFGPGLSKLDFDERGIRTIPIRNCNVQIHAGWICRKKQMLSPEAEEFVALLDTLYQK